MAAVLFVISVVIVGFIQSIPALLEMEDPLSAITFVQWRRPLSVFYVLPTFVFAFGSHFTLLPLYQEMKNRKPGKMRIIINVGTFSCLLMYLVMGAAGYLTFLDQTENNVLNGFDERNMLAVAAKGFVFFVIVFSHPLSHFAARECIENVFFSKRSFSWIRWIAEATCICTVALLLALLIPNITDIFGLTGSTMACLTEYIFPELLYLRLIWNKPHYRLRKVVAIGVIAICTIIGITSTCAVITEIILKYTKQ